MQESVFVEKIKTGGGRVFLVGGWVRDMLRGTAAKDKDYVIASKKLLDMAGVKYRQLEFNREEIILKFNK